MISFFVSKEKERPDDDMTTRENEKKEEKKGRKKEREKRKRKKRKGKRPKRKNEALIVETNKYERELDIQTARSLLSAHFCQLS